MSKAATESSSGRGLLTTGSASSLATRHHHQSAPVSRAQNSIRENAVVQIVVPCSVICGRNDDKVEAKVRGGKNVEKRHLMGWKQSLP